MKTFVAYTIDDDGQARKRDYLGEAEFEEWMTWAHKLFERVLVTCEQTSVTICYSKDGDWWSKDLVVGK